MPIKRRLIIHKQQRPRAERYSNEKLIPEHSLRTGHFRHCYDADADFR